MFCKNFWHYALNAKNNLHGLDFKKTLREQIQFEITILTLCSKCLKKRFGFGLLHLMPKILIDFCLALCFFFCHKFLQSHHFYSCPLVQNNCKSGHSTFHGIRFFWLKSFIKIYFKIRFLWGCFLKQLRQIIHDRLSLKNIIQLTPLFYQIKSLVCLFFTCIFAKKNWRRSKIEEFCRSRIKDVSSDWIFSQIPFQIVNSSDVSCLDYEKKLDFYFFKYQSGFETFRNFYV